MSYTVRDHATDMLVDVTAETTEAALEAAAYAAVDTMLDRRRVAHVESRRITVRAKSPHEMLYLWLEEIIYQTVTRGFAICRVEASVSKHDASARLDGEALDTSRHRFRVEIKAPTYHEMQIRSQDGAVSMRFLMDL